MDVSELIDLVSELSFGRSMPTDKERKIYLRFLNLANLELWQLVINSGYFLNTVDIFLDDNEYEAPCPDGYYIKELFADGTTLKKGRFEDIFNIPQEQYNIVNGNIIISKNQFLKTKADPDNENAIKRYIVALVLPNNKELVETVDNEVLETNTPVYPVPYHLGLVHGALFYLYISNKGFSEKIKYQMLAWDEAKKSIANYYR